jgi:hypothetical protein
MSIPSSSTRFRDLLKDLALISRAKSYHKVANRNGCVCNEMVVSQRTMARAKVAQLPAESVSVAVLAIADSLARATNPKRVPPHGGLYAALDRFATRIAP